MITCAECGSVNDDNAKFCGECGKPLPKEQKCPQCGALVPLGKKFCGDCGASLSGNSVGGLIGNKNVIAGDVTNTVTSNTYITHNQDDSKKAVTCAVCGLNMLLTKAYRCPECGEYVCKEHFVSDENMCTKCAEEKNKKKESSFKQKLEEVFSDGIVDSDEYEQLFALSTQLGITKARATDLISEMRAKINKNSAIRNDKLSDIEEKTFQRAIETFYVDGNAKEASRLMESIYARHPQNESVLGTYLSALSLIDAKKAKKIISELPVDLLRAYLANFDIEVRGMSSDNYINAEEILDIAGTRWNNALILKCRKVLLMYVKAVEYDDESYLHQAVDIITSFEKTIDPLEASWQFYVKSLINNALGDTISPVTQSYCKEHNLYFAVVNGLISGFPIIDKKELLATYVKNRKFESKKFKELNKYELNCIIQLARKNDPDAMLIVGDYCLAGNEFQFFAEHNAIEWYKKSALLGNAYAQQTLSKCYELGFNCNKSTEKVILWKAISESAPNIFNKVSKNISANDFLALLEKYISIQPFEEDKVIVIIKERLELDSPLIIHRMAIEIVLYEDDIIYCDEKSNEKNNIDLSLCPKDFSDEYKAHAEAWKTHDNALIEKTWGKILSIIEGYSFKHEIDNHNHSEYDYTSFCWNKKAAEQGYMLAQNKLGSYYYHGIGVTQDYKKAVEWYRKSADQGHAVAQNNLGSCYFSGIGVTQDYKKAVEWYRKSAEQGYVLAQNSLGNCYYDGVGVPQDYKKAVEWYRKAADQGNAVAQNSLGDCYYNGIEVTQDYKKAVEWWRKSADQGYMWAQDNLGDCYYNGIEVTQDYKKAVEWYRKAAEQGNPKSQVALGYCYERGIGIYRNYSEAVTWYKKSAEQDNAKAQYKLGVCYFNGWGVTKDYVESFKWCKKAAEQGYHDAQCHIARCYAFGDGVQRSKKEEFNCYKKYAEQGNPKAQQKLGTFYHFGEVVKRDLVIAEQWYKKSAEQGYSGGQDFLASLYEGQGRMDDAIRWYIKAGEQGNFSSQQSLIEIYSDRKEKDKFEYWLLKSVKTTSEAAIIVEMPYKAYIKNICVSEGQLVKKDQKLFVLGTTILGRHKDINSPIDGKILKVCATINSLQLKETPLVIILKG